MSRFRRDGFLRPIPFLSANECQAILKLLARDDAFPATRWPKDRALSLWPVGSDAAERRLLNLLVSLLGKDVILWGASLTRPAPGVLYPWHVDVESAAPDGQFVTVWIGLENTTQQSGIRFISGSHRGRTVQQIRSEKGRSRKEHSTEMVLRWAREENPDAALVEPHAKDGEAILFDGRIWHGSYNAGTETRTALLLQFAAADCPVRIPDGFDWPFKHLTAPLPPVRVVHGQAKRGLNALMSEPAPVPAALPPLPSSIRRLRGQLAEQRDAGWRRYPLFRGSTAALDSMSCHAAVLSAGYSPHPPHAHDDEELLIILDGEADLLIADRPEYEDSKPLRVKAGDFAYYPTGQHHTIRNPGRGPVSYMMFRWRGAPQTAVEPHLQPTLFRAPPWIAKPDGRTFGIRPVFSAPTRWLRKLHCHVSRVEVGAGYAAHADPYDVAILIRSGTVRTLGQDVGAGGIIYCSAGEVHGMRNVGDEPAHYIVFEFHGRSLPRLARAPESLPVSDQQLLSSA